MPSISRHTLRALGACALMTAVYFLLPLDPDIGGRELALRVVASLLGVLGAAALIGREARRQLGPEQTPVSGLVISLYAAVLLFSLIDYLIAVSDPGQFVGLNTRVDAFYFALTTVTTVGYGDVHAQGQLARVVICAQLLFNGVVIATAASVLTKQVQRRARARRTAAPGPDERG